MGKYEAAFMRLESSRPTRFSVNGILAKFIGN